MSNQVEIVRYKPIWRTVFFVKVRWTFYVRVRLLWATRA